MMISNELQQIHVSTNTQESTHKLNPKAPEFYPRPFSKIPTFLDLPQPYPPPVFIFRKLLLPPFDTKTIYYNKLQNQMLHEIHDDHLGILPSPTYKPTDHLEMGSTDSGSTMVLKARKPRKSGRVPRHATGTWFWVKKGQKAMIDQPPFSYPFGDSTSIMIRNIPVRMSRRELMMLLDEHCRQENEKLSYSDDPASEFDFVYLPIDFKRKGNLGYAFVNFTTWEGASRLYNSWRGSKWENCPYKTQKICQINRAKFQGIRDLKKHFQKSIFRCDTDEYLPVEISPPRNGVNGDMTKLITIGTRV